MKTGKELRQNNFDLMRLMLALAVVFDHSYHLTHASALAWLGNAINGDMARQAYFVISGYFVVLSYEHSHSLRDYTERRIWRIYPAYIVLLAATLLLGAVMTSLSAAQFFSSLDVYKYLFWNLLFLNFVQPGLPGVFQGQLETAMDGALWTLKVEVMFYFCVPVIVHLVRRFGAWKILLGIYLLSTGYRAGFEYLADHGSHAKFYRDMAKQVFGQLTFFTVGSACYYYRQFFGRHVWKLALPAAMIFFLRTYLPLPWIVPAVFGIFIIAIAGYTPYLGNAGKYGDVTYGVYLYHFPVMQTLISLGVYQANAFAGLGLTLFLTILCALLSWHLVEKCWLRAASHYRQIESTPVNRTTPAMP